MSNRPSRITSIAVLLIAGIVAAGCCCPKKCKPTDGAIARVRPAVSTATSAQIEAYRKGVAAMKALPVSDPRSWLYQASMHGFFDQADTALPPVYAPFAVPFVTHAQTNGTWAQCKHNTDAFLVWHRVYLVYFERIMRAVSGQPNLMLPYWDYAVADVNRRRVPPAFRDPQYTPSGTTTPVDNPLYAIRRAALNTGVGALDAGIVDIATGLVKPQFFGGPLGFSNAIEGTPHGNVHVAVADPTTGGVMMGLFETAGQDAIFWTHHANIDRLWDCWLRRGNVNPAAIATAGPFTFVDETGSVVTLNATQLLSMAAAPDYTYQDYSDCDAVPAATARMAMNATPRAAAPEAATVARTTKAVALSDRAVSVKLAIPARNARLLAPPPQAGAGADRVILELQRITAAADPFVIYRVAIGVPAKAGERAREIDVGTFNFFGRVPVAGGAHAAHRAQPFTVELDVTDALGRLTVAGKRAGTVNVSITPTSGVTGESPASLARDFNTAARPSIGAIVLTVLPGGAGPSPTSP